MIGEASLGGPLCEHGVFFRGRGGGDWKRVL